MVILNVKRDNLGPVGSTKLPCIFWKHIESRLNYLNFIHILTSYFLLKKYAIVKSVISKSKQCYNIENSIQDRSKMMLFWILTRTFDNLFTTIQEGHFLSGVE